ncbi:g23 [Coccomyxa elongata]
MSNPAPKEEAKGLPNADPEGKLAAGSNTKFDVVEYSSNPIARFFQFLASFLIPGLGMTCEAYVIFSVGNLKPIFQQAYPKCWGKGAKDCDQGLLNSLTYSQIAGIIVGMLTLGYLTDRIGRKWGSVVTASTMLVGAILLTAADAPSINGLFLMFVIVQGIYGVGVGGEYPTASSAANERANSTKHLQKLRGRTVVLVFSNQGLGNLLNTLVLLILMTIFHQYGPKYNQRSLEAVWRISYGIVLIPLVFLTLWRIFMVKESKTWAGNRRAISETALTHKEVSTAFSTRKLTKLFTYFSSRMMASGVTWFVNDFAFYGNKLFQGVFIKIINPHASLVEVLELTLINSVVGYVGYILAAFVIDLKGVGRMRLQSFGFFMNMLMFLICAAAYPQLTEPANINGFRAIYYLSSFFQQFGPNCTTWLISAELVPTEVRSMAHGWAAAVGKVGALIAGATLELVSNRNKFWISAATGLSGIIFTVLFVPDISFLDLKELDRYWLKCLAGDAKSYHGEAVNPKFLSPWERLCGVGKAYDPNADKSDLKLEETGGN